MRVSEGHGPRVAVAVLAALDVDVAREGERLDGGLDVQGRGIVGDVGRSLELVDGHHRGLHGSVVVVRKALVRVLVLLRAAVLRLSRAVEAAVLSHVDHLKLRHVAAHLVADEGHVVLPAPAGAVVLDVVADAALPVRLILEDHLTGHDHVVNVRQVLELLLHGLDAAIPDEAALVATRGRHEGGLLVELEAVTRGRVVTGGEVLGGVVRVDREGLDLVGRVLEREVGQRGRGGLVLDRRERHVALVEVARRADAEGLALGRVTNADVVAAADLRLEVQLLEAGDGVAVHAHQVGVALRRVVDRAKGGVELVERDCHEVVLARAAVVASRRPRVIDLTERQVGRVVRHAVRKLELRIRVEADAELLAADAHEAAARHVLVELQLAEAERGGRVALHDRRV
mmetsp:Transcript_12737/g.34577  ORF Transcript_12737/g.34577 Transcript_12737/m.34577 type:complete len:400 (-) Transcript_12737:78-1277(-)